VDAGENSHPKIVTASARAREKKLGQGVGPGLQLPLPENRPNPGFLPSQRREKIAQALSPGLGVGEASRRVVEPRELLSGGGKTHEISKEFSIGVVENMSPL